MRIGILTLPLHANYGGILQAYALQTVLERMGHEVKVFDKPLELNRLPLWRRLLRYGKRIIKKYLLGQKLTIFAELKQFRRERVERKYTQPFVDEHIHRYIIRRLTDIRRDDFDAIVVGSDQVWRMMYFEGFWSTHRAADAFLAFASDWDIKRLSYAASFGIDITDVPQEEIRECKCFLAKFDGVSVRESSGVDICEKEFGIDAQWVLDPTMLLGANDYTALIGTYELSNDYKGVLMSYVLDENPEIDALRNEIAKEKNLKINFANVADSGSVDRGTIPQPPVENWLKSFAESDYVVTDSFHACVFSILFHKQFTALGNKKRGLDRFLSLLKIFGLEDRLIYNVQDYKSLPLIDYSKIDERLEKWRIKSLDYLENNLKKY